MATFLLGLLGCSSNLMGGNMDPSKHFHDQKVIALAKATIKGDVKRIDQLVAEGVDVNTRGERNITPLLWSIGKPNKKGIKRLLEHGASPNIVTEDGESFIDFVAPSTDHEYLEMALEHGGDPNIRNRTKETVIFGVATANQENSKFVLRLLLDSGADINAVDYAGMNAAMAAAAINQFEAALFLLESGIDYTQKNQWGYTIADTLERNKLTFNPGDSMYDARTKIAVFLENRGIAVDLQEPYNAPKDWRKLSYEAIGEPLPKRFE